MARWGRNDCNSIFFIDIVEVFQHSGHRSFAAFCKIATFWHDCHQYKVSISIGSDRSFAEDDICGLIADTDMYVQYMLEYGSVAIIPMYGMNNGGTIGLSSANCAGYNVWVFGELTGSYFRC